MQSWEDMVSSLARTRVVRRYRVPLARARALRRYRVERIMGADLSVCSFDEARGLMTMLYRWMWVALLIAVSALEWSDPSVPGSVPTMLVTAAILAGLNLQDHLTKRSAPSSQH